MTKVALKRNMKKYISKRKIKIIWYPPLLISLLSNMLLESKELTETKIVLEIIIINRKYDVGDTTGDIF